MDRLHVLAFLCMVGSCSAGECLAADGASFECFGLSLIQSYAQSLRAPSPSGPTKDSWTCHTYLDNQDDDWCQDIGVEGGFEYAFNGGSPSPCGGCWCCKRKFRESSGLKDGLKAGLKEEEKEEEKRVDPFDGKQYNLKEFRAKYKHEYEKSDVMYYWEHKMMPNEDKVAPWAEDEADVEEDAEEGDEETEVQPEEAPAMMIKEAEEQDAEEGDEETEVQPEEAAAVTKELKARHYKVSLGKSASLDEAGYQKVAASKSNEEMAAFIVRAAAEKLDSNITDMGGLAGLVPYYSGQKSRQHFERLLIELEEKVNSGSFWIRPLNSSSVQPQANMTNL